MTRGAERLGGRWKVGGWKVWRGVVREWQFAGRVELVKVEVGGANLWLMAYEAGRLELRRKDERRSTDVYRKSGRRGSWGSCV